MLRTQLESGKKVLIFSVSLQKWVQSPANWTPHAELSRFPNKSSRPCLNLRALLNTWTRCKYLSKWQTSKRSLKTWMWKQRILMEHSSLWPALQYSKTKLAASYNKWWQNKAWKLAKVLLGQARIRFRIQMLLSRKTRLTKCSRDLMLYVIYDRFNYSFV